MKPNLDAIKSILLDVPIGLGALAGLLAACGIDVTTNSRIIGIVGAAAVLGLWGVGALKRAFNQTDAGKAATIERLDPAGQAAVLEKLPDVTKAAAAAQVEGLKVVPTTIEGAQILESLPPEAKAANS